MRIIPLLWETLKIDHQISSIRDPTIRTTLSRFISSELDRNIRILRAQLRQNKPDDIVRTRLCSFFSIIMDAYMLGRMLRHFSDNDHPRRIIAYTGDGHYERFVRFLRSLRTLCIHQSIGPRVRNPFRRQQPPSEQITPLIYYCTIVIILLIIPASLCVVADAIAAGSTIAA